MIEITQSELIGIIVRLITATVGTLGFALIFKVLPRRLPFAMLGGFVTGLVYELVYVFYPRIAVAAFVSALVMALYSEAMARMIHAPTILFLLTGAVPIVPGNGLYQSIRGLLTDDMVTFEIYVKSTLETLIGITVGLGVASIVVGIALQVIKSVRAKIVR